MDALIATAGGLGIWLIIASLPVIVLVLMAGIRRRRNDLSEDTLTSDLSRSEASFKAPGKTPPVPTPPSDEVPTHFDQSA